MRCMEKWYEWSTHPSPEDNYRFSHEALREMFADEVDILEHGWRLKIGPEVGIKDLQNFNPQAIETAYLIGRGT